MSDGMAETVLAIVASVKRIPREQIALGSRLQDLGIDSLDTIVFLCELEEKFQISSLHRRDVACFAKYGAILLPDWLYRNDLLGGFSVCHTAGS